MRGGRAVRAWSRRTPVRAATLRSGPGRGARQAGIHHTKMEEPKFAHRPAAAPTLRGLRGLTSYDAQTAEIALG